MKLFMITRILGYLFLAVGGLAAVMVVVIVGIVQGGRGNRPLFDSWTELGSLIQLIAFSVVPLAIGIVLVKFSRSLMRPAAATTFRDPQPASDHK
jgi:hypothetical protein